MTYDPELNVLVGYDPVFNVLKLDAQRTNPQNYSSFILMMFFLVIFNKFNSWFLYGNKISISSALIYSQLH